MEAALPKWQQKFFSVVLNAHPASWAEKLSDAAQAKYKSEWNNPEASIVVAAEKDLCCAKCEGTIPEGSTYIQVGISMKDYYEEGKTFDYKDYHKKCQPYLLTIKSVVGKGLGPCGVGVQSTGVYGHLL